MEKHPLKLDAAESDFFLRELEQVMGRTHDVKYAQLKARDFIPVNNEIDPGVEKVTFTSYDKAGLAKIVTSYATDFPRVDVSGTQVSVNVKSLGASYGYSVQDIRAARHAKKPLEQQRANMARRAVAAKEDSIAALGDADTGMIGLLNITNAGTYTPPSTGSGNALTFASKSAANILVDLNGIAQKIVNDTKEVEIPDTLLLPTAQYSQIATTQLSSGSNLTVLQFFLMNTPWIKNVASWTRLAGAGSGATDRMVCYRRDPDALELIVPQEFEQFPPQPEGMEFKVHCHQRLGGVLCYYPLSVCYGDGI